MKLSHVWPLTLSGYDASGLITCLPASEGEKMDWPIWKKNNLRLGTHAQLLIKHVSLSLRPEPRFNFGQILSESDSKVPLIDFNDSYFLMRATLHVTICQC